MKVLKDFTTNNRPKHARSALWPKREEIFELARQNFSTYQIAAYLKGQKIKATQQNVSSFLKKHCKNKTQGDTNPTNYQPAPARAHQSPASSGREEKINNGAEARAEAENEDADIWGVKINPNYTENLRENYTKHIKKD